MSKASWDFINAWKIWLQIRYFQFITTGNMTSDKTYKTNAKLNKFHIVNFKSHLDFCPAQQIGTNHKEDS